MQLSYEAIKILKGDYGNQKKQAMEEIITFGEEKKAKKLIRVDNFKSSIHQTNYGEICIREDNFSSVFLNSVVGARVNQIDTTLIQSINLLKRVPLYGLYESKNRLPTLEVQVQCEMKTMNDYDILGYYIGEYTTTEIPLITLMTKETNYDLLKSLSFSLSLSEPIKMFHLLDETQEIKFLLEKKSVNDYEQLKFTQDDKNTIVKKFNTATNQIIDAIFIGKPFTDAIAFHTFINQLNNSMGIKKEIVCLLDHYLYKYILKVYNIKKYNDNGIYFISTQGDLSKFLRKNSFNRICTNTSYFVRTFKELKGVEIFYGSMKDCLEAAVSGYWRM